MRHELVSRSDEEVCGLWRARRKEYWMFFLFNCIIAFVLGFIEGMFRNLGIGHGSLNIPGDPKILSFIYSLAVLVPGIAVGVRRMHDTGRSGWWLLLPIVNIVFLCQDSQPGENQYGPNPKAEGQYPKSNVIQKEEGGMVVKQHGSALVILRVLVGVLSLPVLFTSLYGIFDLVSQRSGVGDLLFLPMSFEALTFAALGGWFALYGSDENVRRTGYADRSCLPLASV